MRLDELAWDGAAEDHIARHAVGKVEVEDICFGPSMWTRSRGSDRYVVFGRTKVGRYLMVVIERIEEGVFYPVTARSLTNSERRRFQAWRGPRRSR